MTESASPEDSPTANVGDVAGVDPAALGAAQALMRTLHLQRQLMQRLLAEIDSPETHPGQAMCLRALAANDGIAQRDLAEMLHVSRPTVTHMLQRMEAKGTIERRVDPRDQRLTRVHLTPDGQRLEAHLRVVFAEYVRQTFGLLPESDRRELERLLRALSENAERALHETGVPNPKAVTMKGNAEQ